MNGLLLAHVACAWSILRASAAATVGAQARHAAIISDVVGTTAHGDREDHFAQRKAARPARVGHFGIVSRKVVVKDARPFAMRAFLSLLARIASALDTAQFFPKTIMQFPFRIWVVGPIGRTTVSILHRAREDQHSTSDPKAAEWLGLRWPGQNSGAGRGLA